MHLINNDNTINVSEQYISIEVYAVYIQQKEEHENIRKSGENHNEKDHETTRW